MPLCNLHPLRQLRAVGVVTCAGSMVLFVSLSCSCVSTTTVYLATHIYKYKSMDKSVKTCVYAHMYVTYTCLYVWNVLMNEFMYVCMFACMHACVRACVWICVFICMYIYALICIYMYICKYIYIYIRAQKLLQYKPFACHASQPVAQMPELQPRRIPDAAFRPAPQAQGTEIHELQSILWVVGPY